MSKMTKPARWWGKRPGLFVNNSRFYILMTSILLSVAVICFLRIQIVSDSLYLIRVQQIFGFMALGFWYLALLATPLGVLFGKQGFMVQYLYARRALGVSAAYFAMLHMLFGIFGQLGGLNGLLMLPGRFQLAIIFGGVGLLTLLAMALTSFDKVIAWMTFPRWKWLHRVGYIAACFVLFHIWLIGTHLESGPYRIILFGFLILLVLAESWRVALLLEKLSGEKNWSLRLLIFMSLSVIIGGLIAFVPSQIERYHEDHTSAEHQT